MGSLRTAAVEFRYKETDRQLNEQFIHRLKDSEMLIEMKRKFTNSNENTMIPSECVLT